MAQLSEADMKQLLGENYQATVEKAAEQTKNRTIWQRFAETLRANCGQVRSSALTVASIAAIIAVTNYLQVSGPYQRTLEIGAGTVVLVGAVCAFLAQLVLSRHN